MSTTETKNEADAAVPDLATQAVLMESTEMPADAPICKGYDFNAGVDLDGMMHAYKYMGFQGTNMGKAVERINEMRRWRLSDEPWTEKDGEELRDPKLRKEVKATIFFSYTSNMISSGNREVIRFLVQHKMVDVIVTTGGGIEEDFLKCFQPHYMGGFALKGSTLRKQGLNRIGNLIVPNKNYCLFEDWFAPLLNKMHDEQETDGTVWSPSKMIRRMGKEINNPESVYYWAYKNDIPVYCPALTDGSVGDMIFFHSYKREGFVLDIAQDIRGVNEAALTAKKSGMLILGGGLVKHHVCNANLMRNGADWAVFVNTGQEFDGSDSGARPDEAISWGKIKMGSHPVKVYADATLVFPLLVAQTFAKGYHAGEYGPVDEEAKAAALAAPTGEAGRGEGFSGAGEGAGAGAAAAAAAASEDDATPAEA